MEFKRILTISFEESEKEYQNHIVCPYCGEGKIEFQEDNYPKGEDKQCPKCGKHISIRTLFTNM